MIQSFEDDDDEFIRQENLPVARLPIGLVQLDILYQWMKLLLEDIYWIKWIAHSDCDRQITIPDHSSKD